MAIWIKANASNRSIRYTCSKCRGIVYWWEHPKVERRECPYPYCPYCQEKMVLEHEISGEE